MYNSRSLEKASIYYKGIKQTLARLRMHSLARVGLIPNLKKKNIYILLSK